MSLTVPAGQVVAVIGLNGAGKTTLLRMLAGIMGATRGEIFFAGERFRRDRLDLRRRMMFLPDLPVLYYDQTVIEHIALMLRVYERPDTPEIDDRVLTLLADLDLMPLAERPIQVLSRGQIYKAALAGLCAVQPDLWLLDEPFASGVDPQGLAVLKQRARASVAAGGTVIYSTQILEVAEKFCDLLCVIDRGKLVATYTRADLAALPAHGPDSLEMRLRQFRELTT